MGKKISNCEHDFKKLLLAFTTFFSRYSLPVSIASDNGSCFISEEFCSELWCQTHYNSKI